MRKDEWIALIDQKIDEARDAVRDDTVRLVRIRSVKGDPLPGAPFGEGPRKVLDEVLTMGAEAGFHTEDYGVGVVSAALKAGQADVGIWLHGDVVPEGDGWIYEPYEPTVLPGGFIVGRGVTDNKGQLAAIYELLKIFAELKVPLSYNPALYVGSNEETGMEDICGIPDHPDARGFINVCTPPRLSLVPDGGFPLGYGGKGGMNVWLKSTSPLVSCTLTAGPDASPGLAEAVFGTAEIPDTLPGCTVIRGEGTTVSAFTPPQHGAHPNPDGNMITVLSRALLETDALTKEEREIFTFFRDVSSDTAGKMFGIDVPTEKMPPLTVNARRIVTEDGYPVFWLNIRYPIEITADEILRRIADAAGARGFVIDRSTCGVKPYIVSTETAAAQALLGAARDVMGSDAQPFLLGGGTYAHRLPNAYVYGMSGNQTPPDFPKGHGGAHGQDECVSLDRLQRAMKIYARALLALNDTEF